MHFPALVDSLRSLSSRFSMPSVAVRTPLRGVRTPHVIAAAIDAGESARTDVVNDRRDIRVKHVRRGEESCRQGSLTDPPSQISERQNGPALGIALVRIVTSDDLMPGCVIIEVVGGSPAGRVRRSVRSSYQVTSIRDRRFAPRSCPLASGVLRSTVMSSTAVTDAEVWR